MHHEVVPLLVAVRPGGGEHRSPDEVAARQDGGRGVHRNHAPDVDGAGVGCAARRRRGRRRPGEAIHRVAQAGHGQQQVDELVRLPAAGRRVAVLVRERPHHPGQPGQPHQRVDEAALLGEAPPGDR